MKGFEKAIKHPIFKYAMYTLALINLYGYVTKKKFNCLLSFVAAVMVTHYFIRKSIPLALLIGLFISTFVLGCGKILEGATSSDILTVEEASSIAEKLGLDLGGGDYDFAGSYGVKGLYAYNKGPYDGMAFFGTNGDKDGQEKAQNSGGKYRPQWDTEWDDRTTKREERARAAAEAAAAAAAVEEPAVEEPAVEEPSVEEPAPLPASGLVTVGGKQYKISKCLFPIQ